MSAFSNLTKVNESFVVYRYDNGFMLEVSGRDKAENWKTHKVLCTTEAELIARITEINQIELDR